MARSRKKGIDYFTIDTDIYMDRKLRRVRHTHGAGAMAVVLSVLCHIYGENGYYIDAGPDLYFDLAGRAGTGGKLCAGRAGELRGNRLF